MIDALTQARRMVGKDYKNSNKINRFTVPPTVVDYTKLKDELGRLIKIAESGLTLDGTKPSVFIFGPTGSGKSEIIKQVSEESGAIFHKIEPQKVPIEQLQGFPFLHDKENGMKVVKLASPTILPPSDDERVWVLFLDEFNKADTESMAAIMNLVLNGEIGGFADFNEKTGKSEKYTLPKRTVIIGAGNMAEQEGSTETNQVNTFDIATAERWHRVLYLEYDVESWMESFALNPYKTVYKGKEFEFPSRIPAIILNYLITVYMEGMNKKSPFLIPKPLENEHDISSTMSPRAWTLLANSMISDFLMDYENPVQAFCNPNDQISVLIKNVNELGLKGQELVDKIIAAYKFNYDNNVSPDQIYGEYGNVNERVKNISKGFGMKTYMIVELADFIKKFGEGKLFTFNKDSLANVANVSSFFTDIGATAEDIATFIATVNVSNDFGKGFSIALSKVNKKYSEAYSYLIHTNFNNI